MLSEEEKEQLFTKEGSFLIGLFALFLLTFIFAFIFMYLWNNVCVEVISTCKEITYWQSVGMIYFLFFLGRLINFTKSSK